MTEHQHCKLAARSDRPPAPKRAFTLVELMVVMFVMMVLVALAVGVSKYVMDKSARDQTIATQSMLMAAINACGDTPLDAPTMDALLSQLMKVPAAKQLLEKLDSTVINRKNKVFTILDGYGNAMLYDPVGGLGACPVFVSGGPDGVIRNDPGTTENEEADNIRSDGRGK